MIDSTTTRPLIRPHGNGEVSPSDDYSKLESSGKEEIFPGYLNPGRTDEDKEKWASDTDDLAKWSIRSHIVEAALKIPSYFLTHSEFDDSWIAKIIFTVERITGTVGDMFRNSIYGHRDNNGNRDDNVGAEEFTRSEGNKNSWIPSLSIFNNELQTKGKFLVALLGLISPSIANDVEWAGVRLFDGMWWRNMGINIAFGPNFTNKLYKQITNKLLGKDSNALNNTEEKITWDFVKSKFQKHLCEVKNSWNQYRNSKPDSQEKNKSLMTIYQNLDRTISCFTPIINWLNVLGDLARPIARRLDIQGLPRTTIRLLSVIDRPILWLNNIFRFYLPEKILRGDQNRNKLFPWITLSDLLLTSTITDIFDFGLIIAENKIKESSGSIQHLIEIGRRLKDSAQDIYFSARRRRGLEEFNKQKSLYEKLENPGYEESN